MLKALKGVFICIASIPFFIILSLIDFANYRHGTPTNYAQKLFTILAISIVLKEYKKGGVIIIA